jgi:hypothetical protein
LPRIARDLLPTCVRVHATAHAVSVELTSGEIWELGPRPN